MREILLCVCSRDTLIVFHALFADVNHGIKVSFWSNYLQEMAVKAECHICLQKQNFLIVWLLLEVATYRFGCLIKWFWKIFLDFRFSLISIFSRPWLWVINVSSTYQIGYYPESDSSFTWPITDYSVCGMEY